MFCVQCGTEIASGDSFCSKCGKPAAPRLPVAQNNKKTRTPVWLWLLIGFVAIIAMLIAASPDNSPTSSQPVATIPAPASVKPKTGNVANDRLLAMSEGEQATYLGAVVEDNCVGERAFYMGLNRIDQNGYWSVGCTNGNKYMVAIAPDSVGSTKILDCSMLKLVAKMNCFHKLEK
jgi:predicted nucleic acid-binding Zn ribbon protein